jgi:hypothetical protein
MTHVGRESQRGHNRLRPRTGPHGAVRLWGDFASHQVSGALTGRSLPGGVSAGVIPYLHAAVIP